MAGRVAMRLAVLFTVLWLVAGFQSCQDVRYSIWGKEVKGTVKDVRQRTDRRGEPNGYNVVYIFAGPGGAPVEGDSAIGLEDRQRFGPGQPLEIEYIDNARVSSRAKGTSSPWWMRFFLGSTVAMVFLVAGLSVHASREERKPRRGGR